MQGPATSRFSSIKTNQIHLPIRFLSAAIHQPHHITADNMCVCGCLCKTDLITCDLYIWREQRHLKADQLK